MRIHHLLGGLVLALAAAGLGALIASPILGALARNEDAQSAREIGILFLVPFSLPAMLTVLAILRARQVGQLRAAVDQAASHLISRHTVLTAPKGPTTIESRKWSDEVWEYRRTLAQKLPLLSDRAVLRIVTRRICELAAQRTAAAPGDRSQLARRAGAALLRLGWSAQLVYGRSPDEVHVLAERYGIRALVLCRPRGEVGPTEVRKALRARVHFHADLGAILANGPFSPDADALAGEHEIGLLRVGQLKAVHRAAGKLWRARHRHPAADPPPPLTGNATASG